MSLVVVERRAQLAVAGASTPRAAVIKRRARVNSSGTINTTSSPTYTQPVTVGYTYLTVIDPQTGDNLWSDSKRWGNLYTGFHSATKGLVDELVKRMDGH